MEQTTSFIADINQNNVLPSESKLMTFDTTNSYLDGDIVILNSGGLRAVLNRAGQSLARSDFAGSTHVAVAVSGFGLLHAVPEKGVELAFAPDVIQEYGGEFISLRHPAVADIAISDPGKCFRTAAYFCGQIYLNELCGDVAVASAVRKIATGKYEFGETICSKLVDDYILRLAGFRPTARKSPLPLDFLPNRIGAPWLEVTERQKIALEIAGSQSDCRDLFYSSIDGIEFVHENEKKAVQINKLSEMMDEKIGMMCEIMGIEYEPTELPKSAFPFWDTDKE